MSDGYRHQDRPLSPSPAAEVLPRSVAWPVEPVRQEQPALPDMADMRLCDLDRLRALAMRVDAVIAEKQSGRKLVGSGFSPIMVEVAPGHFMPAPVAAIARRAAAEGGISVAKLVGTGRKHVVARPRQIAMASARLILRDDGKPAYSFPQIGKFFRRDHTTVIHACKIVEDSDLIRL